MSCHVWRGRRMLRKDSRKLRTLWYQLHIGISPLMNVCERWFGLVIITSPYGYYWTSMCVNWMRKHIRYSPRRRLCLCMLCVCVKLCRQVRPWDSRLAGLVAKASASGAEDPGFESRFRRDFSRSSHTSDIEIGTPVATLPGAWRYRVSAGTGRPGVSILWPGEVESLICNFSVCPLVKLSVQIRPWDTLACFWDIKQPTNKQTNRPWDTLCVLLER